MTLALPGSARPTNLHLTPDQIHWDLDADTLHWLEELPRAVDGGDRLSVLIHKDHDEPFIIMELADDGTEMFVMRTSSLDQRTYTALRRMRQIPLDKRVEVLDREAAEYQQAYDEALREDLYERVGGPMRHQFYKDGFIDSLGYSAPLHNANARRHRKQEAARKARKARRW